MECFICKNKIGFAFGICIECGYDNLNHKFHTIEVNTSILKQLISEEDFEYLIKTHELKVRKD